MLKAIPKVAFLLLGLLLSLPSVTDIGIKILQALQTAIPNYPYSDLSNRVINESIWALRFIGIALVISDIAWIYIDIKRSLGA